MSEPDEVDEIIEAALKIAAERNRILDAMRHALLAGDHSTGVLLAKRLCGIEDFDIPKKR